MTKQDAAIVLRFHALDSAGSGGSSGCYTSVASIRMQKSGNRQTLFVMDKHAAAG
jgi:hypothetical protein